MPSAQILGIPHREIVYSRWPGFIADVIASSFSIYENISGVMSKKCHWFIIYEDEPSIGVYRVLVTAF